MNVCKFIPENSAPDTITIINFVYELEKSNRIDTNISAVYKMNYVTHGSAEVSCNGVKKTVKKGDIFFLLPAVPYVIEGDADFKYMYVSYFGIRAGMLMERLGINYRNFVFEKFSDLYSFWKEAISQSEAILDIASESVVLYTLSKIGDRLFVNHSKGESSNSMETFLNIKKYIDDNLSAADLSLKKISAEFMYNEKYLSSAFKQHFKIGITEYITIARVQLARVLMEQNYTSVKDIAEMCGFKDSLYFSKVFKQRVGTSPKSYMNSIK